VNGNRTLRPAASILLLLTAGTGVLYPALVTGIAQILFPWRANGSLLREGDSVVGSELIGQPFSDPRYFWSRPSATTPFPCNAAASTGSNIGPTNPGLLERVRERVEALRAADPGNGDRIPVDLVTSSGSGLDPHISPAAALCQVGRVARLRGLEEARVRSLVVPEVEEPFEGGKPRFGRTLAFLPYRQGADGHVEGRTLGLLGEPRVNVLRLNLAVDRLSREGR
jgi:potassium-transporting ATPase KdpC subunit